MRLYLSLSLVFFCGIALAETNPLTLPPTTLPLNPGDLLSCLKGAPPDKNGTWQLTQARAYNEYENNWLISHALRSFVLVPNQETTNQAQTANRKVTIQLIDTGYSPGANTIFLAYSRPGSSPKLKTLGGYPFITMGGKSDVVGLIWVAQRFIVRIEFENDDNSPYEMWFKQVDVEKLLAAPSSPVTIVPRPYEQVRIDELNPANNSIVKGTYTTEEEVEAMKSANQALVKEYQKKQSANQGSSPQGSPPSK